MRLAALALVVLVAGPGEGWALPDGFIDPSNATVKTGKFIIDSAEEATLNVTVTNFSDKAATVIAIACAVLVDGEPVETGSIPVQGVEPHQTAYGTTNFFELHGNRSAVPNCRVEYIRLK